MEEDLQISELLDKTQHIWRSQRSGQHRQGETEGSGHVLSRRSSHAAGTIGLNRWDLCPGDTERWSTGGVMEPNNGVSLFNKDAYWKLNILVKMSWLVLHSLSKKKAAVGENLLLWKECRWRAKQMNPGQPPGYSSPGVLQCVLEETKLSQMSIDQNRRESELWATEVTASKIKQPIIKHSWDKASARPRAADMETLSGLVHTGGFQERPDQIWSRENKEHFLTPRFLWEKKSNWDTPK